MSILRDHHIVVAHPTRPRLTMLWSWVVSMLVLSAGCGSASHSRLADADPPDSQKGTCGVCIYPWSGAPSRCPEHAPTSVAELQALCAVFGMPRLAIGPCSPADYLLEHCEPTVADPDDDVLSVSFGTHGSDCHYSHTTGQLIGTSVTSDTYTLCDNVSPLAASQGLKNPRCRAGSPAITFDCTSLLPARPDAGDFSWYGDAAVASSQDAADDTKSPDGP